MYDYVRRTYAVNPIVGERVRLEGKAGREGAIASEDRSCSHYVMVRFDGQKHASPCHPTSLTYLDQPAAGADPAAAARASFDEDHTVGPSRGGRGSIKRSHRAEGRNWAGE